MSDMTSTDPAKVPPAPTLDEMLASVDTLLATPVPIGHLRGAIVYLRHSDRTLIIGDAQPVSVDHPYLAGTAIHAEALRQLG